MRDLAYFMMNSVETDLRRRHEREVVDAYLTELGNCGVPRRDLDWAGAWRRYRSHALYVWIACSVTAASRGLQPEAVQRAALGRAGAAVEDLEALEFV